VNLVECVDASSKGATLCISRAAEALELSPCASLWRQDMPMLCILCIACPFIAQKRVKDMPTEAVRQPYGLSTRACPIQRARRLGAEPVFVVFGGQLQGFGAVGCRTWLFRPTRLGPTSVLLFV
jgi:hypothetical protein